MHQKKIIKGLIHVAVIVTIMLVPYLLAIKSFEDIGRLLLNHFAFRYIISFGLFIGFTYLNYFWLVEHFYLKKRFIVYTVWVFGALATIIYLPELVAYPFNKNSPNDGRGHSASPMPPPDDRPPNRNVYDILFPPPLPPAFHGKTFDPNNFNDNLPINPKINVIVFFFISVFISISIQTNKRLQRIENEKLVAELAQLKAQINPHFLFNTLNSIYALAIQNDKKTGESILKLSELMRFILQDAQNSQVSLEKELAFIDNYITLQRYRLTDNMTLDYLCEGTTNGKRIAPLLLMTFIENAFKHGINPDEDCLIRVHLSIFEYDLVLKVFNKKVSLSLNQESSGIGLANTEERLQFLYPSKHRLQTKEDAESYSIELTLTLI